MREVFVELRDTIDQSISCKEQQIVSANVMIKLPKICTSVNNLGNWKWKKNIFLICINNYKLLIFFLIITYMCNIHIYL